MKLSSEFNAYALSKIIHDNEITFKAPESTVFVYYDIETYSSDRSFTEVPSFKYSHCHIATIQLLIVANGVTSKVIFVNDQGDYVFNQQQLEDVKIVMLDNDEQCARAFFSLLRGFKNVIAIAYNGSADCYGHSTKYQW